LGTKLPKDETVRKRNGIDLKQALQKHQRRYVAKKVEGEGMTKHPGERENKQSGREKIQRAEEMGQRKVQIKEKM
jgi:hypothetical protein